MKKRMRNKLIADLSAVVIVMLTLLILKYLIG